MQNWEAGSCSGVGFCALEEEPTPLCSRLLETLANVSKSSGSCQMPGSKPLLCGHALFLHPHRYTFAHMCTHLHKIYMFLFTLAHTCIHDTCVYIHSVHTGMGTGLHGHAQTHMHLSMHLHTSQKLRHFVCSHTRLHSPHVHVGAHIM